MLKFDRPFITVVLLLLAATGIEAQSVLPCATDEHFEYRAQANPQLRELREQADAYIAEHMDDNNFSAEAVHIIPVVVHVMYYNESDIIGMEQIQDAIDVLNEDYSATNADRTNVRSVFQGVQANMEVRFELARIDPFGRCTDGVNYVQSENSLAADITTNAVKYEINWPNKKYLNIWTVREIYFPGMPPGQRVLGYAAFPYSNQPSTDDGIVICHDQMGRIGTATSNGRTLSHEAGHYLNLYHTFQGGCNGGDQCADTPPVSSASFGCNLNKNSCGNDSPDMPDMIENFMDYADDVCVNTFTFDQKARAKAVLNNNFLRGSLTTSANLLATGVTGANSCLPQVDFEADKTYFCIGDSVKFTNRSAYPGTASFKWTASNWTDSIISTQENPTMTFNKPGVYYVNLDVSTSMGKVNKSKPAFIRVVDPTNTSYSNSFSASFETDIPNDNWYVDSDGDDVTWETTTDAAYVGNKSVRVNQYDAPLGGVDNLVSAHINMNGWTSATLEFMYAWAPRAIDDADKLLVQLSFDECGDNWFTLLTITGSTLNTTGTSIPNTPFVPTPAQWKKASINLNAFISAFPNRLR